MNRLPGSRRRGRVRSRSRVARSGADARRASPGFTLIELLVAMVVFAVISAIVYTGLSAVLRTGNATSESLSRLAAVQRAISIMQRDLGQLVDRPVRDGLGDRQPAVYLNDGRLWVTAGGTPNPLDSPRSSLRRVGYELDAERGLIRYAYDALDQPIDPQPTEAVILKGVRDWRLRFRQGGQWTEQWPPLERGGDAPALPRAIAVRLTLEDYGAIKRTYPR